MDRRKFMKDSALMASLWGCGASLLNGCKSTTPQTGEELNKADSFKTNGLRPRDIVLAEANFNINRVRKGRFKVQLLAGDVPVANKPVYVELVDHAFDWGCSSIRSRALFPSENEYLEYMGNIRKVFNATTAKCYWDEGWHQPIEKEEGKRILDVFMAEVHNGSEWGMRVKGHPLVWTVPKAIPSWVKQNSPANRLSILENHVRDLVRKGGDKTNNWDVVNEMLWEPAFKNIDKRNWPHIDPIDDIADYVAQALRWVENENPHVKKLINDYGLIKEFTPLQSVKKQRSRYLELLEALRSRGVVPDAIGVQSHVGKWFEPDEIVRAYDELAQGGVPLHVTEFWAQMKDCPHHIEGLAQEQLDWLLENYLRDFYTVAFGHPAVQHITYWGNPFFDKNIQPTEIYRVLESLICQQWSTKGDFNTNEEGVLSLDAFYGDYMLRTGKDVFTIAFNPTENDKMIHFNLVNI